VVLWPGAQALAQTAAAPERRLEAVGQELAASRTREGELSRAATAAARDLARLKASMIASAGRLRGQETQVDALAARLAKIEAAEQSLAADLAQRRAALAGTLSALSQLRRQPPAAVLAAPESANDLVRASLLLGTIGPELDRRAERLRQDLIRLASLRAAAAGERQALTRTMAATRAERARLAKLMAALGARHTRLDHEAKQAGVRAQGLAEEARDLGELVDRLAAMRARAEAARKAAETKARRAARAAEAAARNAAEAEARRAAAQQAAAARQAAERQAQAEAGRRLAQVVPPKVAPDTPFSARRGRLPLPASGRVVNIFNRPNAFGLPDKGIAILTRPGGVVVAPYDGEIVFAGPFRSYGQLLIIALGEGYHILLAGLGRMDVTVGQHVLGGEPIGSMADAALEESDRPRLYVELRRDGKPIDPVPWLAANQGRVSG